MVQAQGEISLERHEPTGGVVITRETPELDYKSEQRVVIPGDDVQGVLSVFAELEGYSLQHKEVAEAVEYLADVLCDHDD